jgi:hypothetical protein
MADLLGPRRTTAHTGTRPLAEPPRQPAGLVIDLPLEYTAFCLLYQERYLRYTRARGGDPSLSRRLVETALGKVAVNWVGVLASHCPAAEAWGILGSVISTAVRGRPAVRAKPCNAVYRMLSPLQADIVVLRHRLSLDVEQTAELMGVDEPVVSSQLRMAHRNLPHALPAAPARES